jgi:hypothetical protein
MNHPDAWQCLTVEKLFQNFSWQGVSLPVLSEEQLQETKIAEIPWQCLTVARFLKQYNWQGLLISETAENLSPGIQKTTLMFSVREFMRSIDWDGNPKIGVLPALELKKVDLPSSPIDNPNEFF